MVLQTLPSPGYVYVFGNPSLEGWNKVGHTYRPPHKRASELSRTALPHVFETQFARFFWDAPGAEKAVHQHMDRLQPGDRRREFFKAPVSTLRSVIEDLADPGLRPGVLLPPVLDVDAPWASRVADDDWGHSLDGLEDQWAWGEQSALASDPAERRKGWRQLERLSSSGWGEGSWRLAELLLRTQMNPVGAERAAWVAEAAEIQGIVGGALRAAWLRSWAGPVAFLAWRRALTLAWEAWGHNTDPRNWPAKIVDTLSLERGAWATHPDRVVESPWWVGWQDHHTSPAGLIIPSS